MYSQKCISSHSKDANYTFKTISTLLKKLLQRLATRLFDQTKKLLQLKFKHINIIKYIETKFKVL
jgi:hypothetical protein